MEFHLAHVGINCQNGDEARCIAEQFAAIFGFSVTEGQNSVFAGKAVECMKAPHLGKNGHIAICTPDVSAAVQELEAKGIAFNYSSAKYKPDGSLKVIYLAEEIGGFAIHLTEG